MPITDAPAAARSASYDRISIGAMTRQAESNFHSFLDGEISEVLVYNRVLSTSELYAVGTYLGDKYGMTFVPEPISLTMLALGSLVLRRRKMVK